MGMIDASLFSIVEDLLAEADTKLNGTRPWDPKILNPAIYERIIRDGSLRFGESYMDGWWECEQLDGFLYRFLKTRIDELQPHSIRDVFQMIYDRFFNPRAKTIIKHLPIRLNDILKLLSVKFFDLQTKTLAWKVNEVHYNLGNDLFVRMLGPHMQYSCGYWRNGTTFEESEENKIRLICEKLHLKPGMRVLDIGCGFGGLAAFMARNYDVSVTGVTLSREQERFAREHCKGLDVSILLKDYRDLEGQFDRVVSVEMIEHVGPKNYANFFDVVDRCLGPDGIFVLHVISSNKTVERHDDWFDKYLFPNGCFPSLKQIAEASEPFFVVEDLHNMGADFDKTMMAWYERFVDAWPQLSQNHNERFKRMFTFYLNCAAGAFRARRLQLWHIVFSRGKTGGLCVPR
nr:PREDICTED: uncharacterized protein LOC109041065 [Bemisia tabaci]